MPSRDTVLDAYLRDNVRARALRVDGNTNTCRGQAGIQLWTHNSCWRNTCRRSELRPIRSAQGLRPRTPAHTIGISGPTALTRATPANQGVRHSSLSTIAASPQSQSPTAFTSGANADSNRYGHLRAVAGIEHRRRFPQPVEVNAAVDVLTTGSRAPTDRHR